MPEAPEQIGPYKILDTLGSGGMSVVYRAVQTSLDREVAVKVLSSESAGEPEAIARFERESSLVAQLSHPGIIHVIDCGETDGHYFIAMEYVKGCSLEDLLRERRLAVHEVVEIAIQIAQALEYAHSKGVVHRDIKPANILVSADTGAVKVADFGIAQLLEAHLTGRTLTRANVGMGTVDYMAPEQRLSAHDVDGRADVFSFGVVLYEMLTGRLPLGHFKPPEQHRDDTPPLLSRIVARCLQGSRGDRYPDFGSVLEDLEQVTLVNVQYREAIGRVAETVRRVSGRAPTGVLRRLWKGAGAVPDSVRNAVLALLMLVVIAAVGATLWSGTAPSILRGPYAERFDEASALREAGDHNGALEALRAIRTEAGEGADLESAAQAQWQVAGIHRERGSVRSAGIAYGYFANEYASVAEEGQLPEALYWAAHFREREKKPRYPDAVTYYSRLIEEYPRDPRTPEALVRSASIMQEELRVPNTKLAKAYFERVASLHRRVLEEFPGNPAREEALFMLGGLYLEKRSVRDYARSASYYEQLASEFSTSAHEPYRLAAEVVDRKLDQKARALALYEKFLANQPGSKNADRVRRRIKSLRR